MESLKVAIRVRPDEMEMDKCVTIDKKTVRVVKTEVNAISGREMEKEHSFQFDSVYGPSSSQKEVFDQVRPMLEDAVSGYTATVFAFGMTGSGKTYTISGTPGAPGIVPRAVEEIFRLLRRKTESDASQVAMVSLTYVELYNNALYDLLDPTARLIDAQSTMKLKILEDAAHGVHLVGSPGIRTPVSSPEEAMELIARGNKLRATSATKLNERSSRSHTVISLEVLSRTLNTEEGASETVVGKVNLVDLAGSERVKLSGAEGQRMEEAKEINKALSVLGDVLNSLSKYHEDREKVGKKRTEAAIASVAKDGAAEVEDGKAVDEVEAGEKGEVGHTEHENVKDDPASCFSDPTPPHIPFRNSKLTMLLKDSLGGRSKTMMVATIRSPVTFYSQSMTALRYAARAKHIRNIPIKNKEGLESFTGHGDGENKMKRTLDEVTRLRSQLDQRTSDFQRLCAELAELQQAQAKSNVPATPGDSEREHRYHSKIAEMAEETSREKAELQEHMRCLIHGHESALAARQKEFEGLQDKITSYETQMASLLVDQKHNMIYRKQTEFSQQELMAELEQARGDIEKLKSALRDTLGSHKQTKRDFEQAKMDFESEKDRWEKQRDQFLSALQRVTAARARTKAQIQDLKDENESLRAQLPLANYDTVGKMGTETETKEGSDGNNLLNDMENDRKSLSVEVSEGCEEGVGVHDPPPPDCTSSAVCDAVSSTPEKRSQHLGVSPQELTPKTKAIVAMKDKIKGMAENEVDLVAQMEQRLGDLEDARAKLQRLQATWNMEYSSLSAAQIQGETEVDTLRHGLFKAENRIGALEAELAKERARVRQLEELMDKESQGGPKALTKQQQTKLMNSEGAKELLGMLGALKAQKTKV